MNIKLFPHSRVAKFFHNETRLANEVARFFSFSFDGPVIFAGPSPSHSPTNRLTRVTGLGMARLAARRRPEALEKK